MHSFGSSVAAILIVLTSADVCAQGVSPMLPESDRATPDRSPVAARYEDLIAQEQRVAKSSAATTDDFRVVVNRYWSFVRRYPTSGFSDNALWQAASLSAEAFQRFSQDRDKHRAVQLFQWLRDQYPHSPLKADAAAQAEQLAALAALPAPVATPAATDTTIRAVHREILPDVVRVTVELDHEVAFFQERLDGPARLFFDLKGTKTVPPLVDATFRYDSDIVRHIRLGRHPNNTTRVVLDLENVSRYSVFTLYNPYRIVIDAERATRTTAAAKEVETSGTYTTPNFAPTPKTALAGRSVAPNAHAPIARIAPVAPIAPI